MNKKIGRYIKDECFMTLASITLKNNVQLNNIGLEIATYCILCWIMPSVLPNHRNDKFRATSSGSDNDKISMTHIVFLRHMSEVIVHSGMLMFERKFYTNMPFEDASSVLCRAESFILITGLFRIMSV